MVIKSELNRFICDAIITGNKNAALQNCNPASEIETEFKVIPYHIFTLFNY